MIDEQEALETMKLFEELEALEERGVATWSKAHSMNKGAKRRMRKFSKSIRLDSGLGSLAP